MNTKGSNLKKIFGVIVLAVLLTSSINAEESEGKSPCDAEIKKDQPRLSINTLQKKYKDAKKAKKMREAIKYLTQIISLQKQYQSKDNIAMYDNLFALGALYSNTKEHKKTLEILLQVEAVYKSNLNRQKRYVYLLKGMAVKYENLHKNKKSIEYLEKSLSISKKVFGEEHDYTLNIYKLMSEVYKRSNDYAKSIEFYEKFLSNKVKLLNQEDQSIIKYYKHIVQLCLDMGDYKKMAKYNLKI